MGKLKFTDREKNNIRDACDRGHRSWGDENLKTVRDKIKERNLNKQNHSCCYCNIPLNGAFNLIVDIEHIIPKSKCIKHMFTSKNLSVSCERCNVKIKKAKLDFINVELRNPPGKIFRSRFYKFIHPNLDKYDSHLKLNMHIIGRGKKLIKYQVVNNSHKGEFNYDYFRLNELEVNSFDNAQGMKSRVEVIDDMIGDEFKRLDRDLNV
ncbi:HNH endonuclease [Shewanella psychrotolerans]|uniref:HNH endonuclease n=1 Tax=Shewanella psychrotolerans TaxID=2864206 RepID=UPI001C65BF2B|nr:HNH endonuclease [Shewanella psychrotolerans]QYK00357.1 HNH endonuclease [Shewanella psychrotolerans]